MLPIITNIFENINIINEQFIDVNERVLTQDCGFLSNLVDYRNYRIEKSSKSSYIIASSILSISHNSTAFIIPFSFKSNQSLIGNFSIQINYSNQTGFSSDNSKVISILLEDISNPTLYSLELTKFHLTGLKYFKSMSKNNAAVTTSANMADTSLAGALRITRIENILYCYAQISNIWKIVSKTDISGFSDGLNFSFISAPVSTTIGGVNISNIQVNTKPVTLGEQFSNTLIDLNKFDLNIENTSTYSITGGALVLSSIDINNNAETITRYGVTDSDFDSECSITNITGTGLNSILFDFGLYNYYSINKNGFGIRYLAGTTAASNSIVLYQVLLGVETNIATIVLNATSLYIRLKRTGNNFEGFYKINSADAWISLGTFNSIVTNNYKNWVIKTKRVATVGTNTSISFDNFFLSATKIIHAIQDSKISSICNMNKNILIKKLISSNAGIGYSDGLVLGIDNSATAKSIIQTNFNILGNFQIELYLTEIKLPEYSSSYFEILSTPNINPSNKYSSIRICKNNDFSNNKSSVQYLTAKTFDTSNILTTLEMNNNSIYLRITKKYFNTIIYSYSFDSITWVDLDAGQVLNSLEEFNFSISLNNQVGEVIGSSIKLKYFKLNYFDKIIPLNSGTDFNYIVKNNNTSTLYNYNNSNNAVLNNFNSTQISNSGIFRIQNHDKGVIGSCIQSQYFDCWKENTLTNIVSNFTGFASSSASGLFNYKKVIYGTNNSAYQMENKFTLGIGEYTFAFLASNVNANKNVGLTFLRFLFSSDDGSGWDIKMKSSTTPKKQDIVSESFANGNFQNAITNVNQKVDFTPITYYGLTFKFIITSSSIQTQYKLNQIGIWIDVATYPITDSNILGKFFVEIKNLTSSTGDITLLGMSSTADGQVRNKNFIHNNSNYISFNKSLVLNKNKFTQYICFSTFSDPLTLRGIYTESDSNGNIYSILKTNTNTFRISFRNHLGVTINIDSSIQDFSKSQDWLLTIVYSKINGYKLYINGTLDTFLNDGTESGIIWNSTNKYFGRTATGDYLLGKFHQISILEYEDSADNIRNYYQGTKYFISKKLYASGNTI